MPSKSAALVFLILAFVGLFIWFLLSIVFREFASGTKKISINRAEIKVELADTNAKRTQGLSGRKKLPPDSGMLFIFPAKGLYSFWMHGMLFPLDFIWIDKESIVDITENVPVPADEDGDNLPFYSSQFPFDKVLEVPAGFVKERAIKSGDKVKF